MRARKDSGGLPGSEHRNVENAGVEKRFISDAGLRADRLRSFVFLRSQIVRIERLLRNAAFYPLSAELRRQRVGRWKAPTVGVGVIKLFECNRLLQHHSIARREIILA